MFSLWGHWWRRRLTLPGGLLFGFLWVPVLVGGLLLASRALPAVSPLVPPSLVAQLAARYGEGAGARLEEWQHVLERQRSAREWHRVLRVNHFMNRVPFVADSDHWGKPDYWATPAEFLASNGGDCEDFAIAKLFSLQATRVPAEKLRLMYVNARTLNQPHMVLLYIKKPGSAPMVLDNLTDSIATARERTDLEPVYSFNAAGLWLNRPGRPEQKVRDGSGSLLWEDLVRRIHEEGFE